MGRRSRSRLKYEPVRAERELRASFDHLVGAGDEGWGQLDSECPGGSQIDGKAEQGGPLDRQVGRHRPPEQAGELGRSVAVERLSIWLYAVSAREPDRGYS